MRSSPLARRVFRNSQPSPRSSQVLRPQERQWLIVADADAVLSHSRHGGRRRRWVVNAAGRRGGPMRRGGSGLQQHDVARDEQQRRSEERRCGRWATRRVGARSARPARHARKSSCLYSCMPWYARSAFACQCLFAWLCRAAKRRMCVCVYWRAEKQPMRIGYSLPARSLCFLHSPSTVRSINIIERSPLTRSSQHVSSRAALSGVCPALFRSDRSAAKGQVPSSGPCSCPTWQLP